MSRKPFFSVVIPTRNRAQVLPFAIQSVLNQTFGDFEIIVSDNFSRDGTESLVKAIEDDRIRYFKTPESLAIDDSWEFALSKATGEFVTFLSDDDAYVPFRLRVTKEALEKTNRRLLVHKYAFFYPMKESSFDEGTQDKASAFSSNTATIPWFSGEAIDVASEAPLTEMFSNLTYNVPRLPAPIYYGNTPHFSDAVYHKSIFTTLRKRLPKLMKSHRSDYYLGTLILNEVKNYTYLDIPLTILTHHSDSMSARVQQYALENRLDELGEETLVGNVPLDLWTEKNSYADILLEAKSDDEELSIRYDLNWETYYVQCYGDIMLLGEVGVDVNEYIWAFDQTLENEPEELQEKVRLLLREKTPLLDRVLKPLVRNLTTYYGFKRLVMKFSSDYKATRSLVFEGQTNEFETILDVANRFNSDFFVELIEYWKMKSELPEKASLR